MTSSPEIGIQFDHVSYNLPGGRAVLADVSFSVRKGETLILLGRSGCGKTTTLKLINRLIEPSSGTVWVEGKKSVEWNPIALRRRIGYVIQEAGLFPHYTVARNAGLVPSLEGWDIARTDRRVREVLEIVGLSPEEFASRFPSELSGGQRQRAGVARALAADPPILLLDEPFGALDPLTRYEIQQEFRTLQKKLRKTAVFVTHDVREALLLGDRIALFRDGRLACVSTPAEFALSSDPEVAAFLQCVKET